MHIKVPDNVKEHMKKEVDKYSKVLRVALEKDINESDTSNIVNDMLGDIFGYNKFFDVTTEYKIRGQYADYVIKINEAIRMIVEVKAIGIKLSPNHLLQAVTYAANEGIEWVVLTNGHVWQLYHVLFVKPIDKQLVFSVDLLDENVKPSEKIEHLYLLSKESLTKNILDEYWEEETALGADNIVSVMLSDGVLERIRRDLKQLTGYAITAGELRDKLKTEVIREELSSKPIKPFKPAKISRRRAAAKKEEAA